MAQKRQFPKKRGSGRGRHASPNNQKIMLDASVKYNTLFGWYFVPFMNSQQYIHIEIDIHI